MSRRKRTNPETEGYIRMTDMEKLEHLLRHWIEHNDAHIKNYSDWALKAGSAGNKELSGILRQIADDSEKLNGLFNRALEII